MKKERSLRATLATLGDADVNFASKIYFVYGCDAKTSEVYLMTTTLNREYARNLARAVNGVVTSTPVEMDCREWTTSHEKKT